MSMNVNVQLDPARYGPYHNLNLITTHAKFTEKVDSEKKCFVVKSSGLELLVRENLRESMENQALELCQQYYQDFHGVFDTSVIKNTLIAAGGQGQVFKCECSQGLDISNGT